MVAVGVAAGWGLDMWLVTTAGTEEEEEEGTGTAADESMGEVARDMSLLPLAGLVLSPAGDQLVVVDGDDGDDGGRT